MMTANFNGLTTHLNDSIGDCFPTERIGNLVGRFTNYIKSIPVQMQQSQAFANGVIGVANLTFFTFNNFITNRIVNHMLSPSNNLDREQLVIRNIVDYGIFASSTLGCNIALSKITNYPLTKFALAVITLSSIGLRILLKVVFAPSTKEKILKEVKKFNEPVDPKVANVTSPIDPLKANQEANSIDKEIKGEVTQNQQQMNQANQDSHELEKKVEIDQQIIEDANNQNKDIKKKIEISEVIAQTAQTEVVHKTHEKVNEVQTQAAQSQAAANNTQSVANNTQNVANQAQNNAGVEQKIGSVVSTEAPNLVSIPANTASIIELTSTQPIEVTLPASILNPQPSKISIIEKEEVVVKSTT